MTTTPNDSNRIKKRQDKTSKGMLLLQMISHFNKIHSVEKLVTYTKLLMRNFKNEINFQSSFWISA